MPVYPPKFQTWLKAFAEDRDAAAAAVHLHLGGRLDLAAALAIGLKLRRDLQKLGPGKGLAGRALESGEPVRGADFLGTAEGSCAAALPVRTGGGEIRAVVSIAFDDRELDDDMIAELARAAEAVPSI